MKPLSRRGNGLGSRSASRWTRFANCRRGSPNYQPVVPSSPSSRLNCRLLSSAQVFMAPKSASPRTAFSSSSSKTQAISGTCSMRPVLRLESLQPPMVTPRRPSIYPSRPGESVCCGRQARHHVSRNGSNPKAAPVPTSRSRRCYRIRMSPLNPFAGRRGTSGPSGQSLFSALH